MISNVTGFESRAISEIRCVWTKNIIVLKFKSRTISARNSIVFYSIRFKKRLHQNGFVYNLTAITSTTLPTRKNVFRHSGIEILGNIIFIFSAYGFA